MAVFFCRFERVLLRSRFCSTWCGTQPPEPVDSTRRVEIEKRHPRDITYVSWSSARARARERARRHAGQSRAREPLEVSVVCARLNDLVHICHLRGTTPGSPGVVVRRFSHLPLGKLSSSARERGRGHAPFPREVSSRANSSDGEFGRSEMSRSADKECRICRERETIS